MTSKRIGFGTLCIATIATCIFVTNDLTVNAQSTGIPTADVLEDAATALVGPLKDAATIPKAKEVTLTGRVVDIHCFMTGQMPSADAVKCTADGIRAGVPIGLETSEGLIVLGKGINGPAKTLLPFAHQSVEVHGKLFENGGVRYLDISSIKAPDETADDED